MKIIHTYWSKPSITYKNDHSLSWMSEEDHAMSWAFSMLRIKKMGFNIMLYTDRDGYDWLINKLCLPYDSVDIGLEDIDIPLNLWSLSKIWVYAQQKEPFIHIDGDVYIWDDEILQHLSDNEILCQHIESNYPYYQECFEYIKKKNFILPDNYIFEEDNCFKNVALNCGVIGSSNYEVFQLLWELAFSLYNKNKEKCTALAIGANTFFEQFAVYLVSHKLQIKIKTVFCNEINFLDGDSLLNFHAIPYDQKYIHLSTSAKKNPRLIKELENRLRFEFPMYYGRIKYHYCNDGEISIPYKLTDEDYKHVSNYLKTTCSHSDVFYDNIYKLVYSKHFCKDEFLHKKFVLSKEYSIITLSKSYNLMLQNSINEDLSFSNDKTESIEYFITLWNNRLFIKEIDNWDNLLCVFVKPTTGIELIHMLEKLKLICKDETHLTEKLVSIFLLSKLLYFQELRIS